jgi:hypothetical protein
MERCEDFRTSVQSRYIIKNYCILLIIINYNNNKFKFVAFCIKLYD